MLKTPAARLDQPALVAQPGPARALDLETMFFVRNVLGLSWSADGATLYFETNITGRYNLWSVPSGGGWPVQLSVSEERTALVETSIDGRFLLYSQDRDGNEKPNLFLMDPSGGRGFALTTTDGIGYEDSSFSFDSRHLAFAAELEGPGKYGIYLMTLPPSLEALEVGHPHPRLLVPAGDRMWGSCVWSRDNRWLAVTHTTDGLHLGVAVVDLEGHVRELIPNDGHHRSRPVAWSPDGTKILINSNLAPSDQQAPGLLDASTGEIEWLVDSPWEATALGWSPDGRFIVWKLNEAGREVLFLRDVRTGNDLPVPIEAGVFNAVKFSMDGTRLALHAGAADRISDLWVYPLGGKAYQVTNSLVGGLTPRHFVLPHLVTFPSSDNTPIAGFLYLPRGAEPDGSHPGIVMVRGGPTAQTQHRWSRDIQYLTSRGFVVLAPNYRGSTGFGRAFQEANRRDLGGGDLRDVVAARHFLVSSGFADPKRVAVMGGSYGGYLTLMALTKAPDLWAAGVAIVPFANWFTEYENEDETLQAFDRMMMGDPIENREFWIERSPYFFVDQIRAPLLMLAGANDIRCPASETLEIAEKIKQIGGVVEAKIYENEGHGFMKRENAIDSFTRTVHFLERHLLGE